MTYLWINPVSERMISGVALEGLLRRHQLTRVTCQGDWGEIVLRKYRELLEHADETFADARCPAAVSLVHSLQPEIRIADIEPILIHCARELAERPDLANGEKIITTPCRILADMGNKRHSFCTMEPLSRIDRRTHGTRAGRKPDPTGIL